MSPSTGGVERATFAELGLARFHDLLRLRVDVFVVEQECAYAELDGLDPVSDHWWIEEPGSDCHSGGIIAVARTYRDSGVTVIGRVATRRDRRRRGLARTLVEAIVASGPREFRLEAQAHLVDWYRSMGFEATGPEVVLDGIPHVPMALSLDRPRPTGREVSPTP